jgi:acyl-CoA synthetase (AMP-forming)/AMP-acid ligase II
VTLLAPVVLAHAASGALIPHAPVTLPEHVLSPGGVVALQLDDPRLLVAALTQLLDASAVPLVLPPGLPEERAADVAERVGASQLLREQDGQLHAQRLGTPLTLAFPGYLTCTSGTTGGAPRVYAFRTEAARENARAHLESIGAQSARVIALPMPLSHSFGLVAGWLSALVSGATLVAFRDTPDPLTLLRVAGERGVDTLAFTPPLARLLLKAARRKALSVPASLRRVTVGSAAMSAAELLALRALFPDAELYFTYGQTELGPRVSTLHVDARALSLDGPVTLGRPLRGVAMRVADGSLHVRSPYVSAGRLERSGMLPLCAAPHGFVDTRDAAEELPGSDDVVPRVVLRGRLDGVLVRGGTNVYPEDVEGAALGLEGIAGAACVPRPSPMYGELPVLLCELSEGAPAWSVLEPALRAHLDQTLPATAVPVELHPVARLPRGPLGKVLRREALALLDAQADPAGGTP